MQKLALLDNAFRQLGLDSNDNGLFLLWSHWKEVLFEDLEEWSLEELVDSIERDYYDMFNYFDRKIKFHNALEKTCSDHKDILEDPRMDDGFEGPKVGFTFNSNNVEPTPAKEQKTQYYITGEMLDNTLKDLLGDMDVQDERIDSIQKQLEQLAEKLYNGLSRMCRAYNVLHDTNEEIDELRDGVSNAHKTLEEHDEQIQRLYDLRNGKYDDCDPFNCPEPEITWEDEE